MGVNSTAIGYHEQTAVYINEPSLYKLIYRSTATHVDAFTYGVCSEVLPSIRKTGSYMTKEKAIKQLGLIAEIRMISNNCN